jgi:HKD family nuclease
MILENITQPDAGTTLDALKSLLARSSPTRIDIAVAYITSGGAEALIRELVKAAPGVGTRWLTSFDYWRTEPVALEAIRDLANAKVRIHDSSVLDRERCMPVRPFHPKTFIFTGVDGDFVLAGSGNLSKSGLKRGHEAGIVVGAAKPPAKNAAAAAVAQSIDGFRAWFDVLWNDADPLSPALLRRYAASYESQPNLSHPTPTDDDTAPERTKSGQISAANLRKLRACRNLWIEAGQLGENLGKNKPGNQLMMKRLTRVFFGIEARDVPRDTALGQVELNYHGSLGGGSLTFSNNGMDKITLPAPGHAGPPKYDGEDLLFRRVAPGVFELSLGTKRQKGDWLRRSRRIDAAFKLQGGRQWGVF